MASLLRVGDVAGKTGVSIRTLHHYDRIGLLRPSGYSDGGHRLYSDADLLRLQQILTLRYLGFPLKRIGELLERPDFDLVASLHAQRRAVRDRITELERIERTLAELVNLRLTSDRWEWDLVNDLARTVHEHLSEKGQTMERYYTPEQMAQFAELSERLPEDEIRTVEVGWADLLADVRAGKDLDPASPEAQELARRWDAMLERAQQAYAGYEELWGAIGENFAATNFEDHPQAPGREDFALIDRVREASSDR